MQALELAEDAAVLARGLANDASQDHVYSELTKAHGHIAAASKKLAKSVREMDS